MSEKVLCSGCHNTREVLVDKLTDEEFCSGCGKVITSNDVILQ